MGTCEQYHELLWDHLYGLVEGDAAGDVNVHLEVCPECRLALEKVRGHQQSLASAARILDKVPAFVLLPDKVTPAVAAVSTEITAHTPAVRPEADAPLPIRTRSMRRLAVSWLSAAAAVAALVIGIVVHRQYSSGRSTLQDQVAHARREVQKVETQFGNVLSQVERANKAQEKEKVAAVEPTHLHVAAPASFHPQAPWQARMVTRDVNGLRKPSELKVEIADAKDGKLLYEEKLKSDGDKTITVPGGRLNTSKALLTVSALGDDGAQIQETLTQAEPTHVSHLALNKSIYQPGEVVFFRSLTLERFTTQPPAQSIPLRFALLNAQGQTAMQLEGQTGAGGIGGGEFALTDDLPAGSYTLQVASPDARLHLTPQARSLEIQRPEAFQVETDRADYGPGDSGNLNLRVRNTINNQPMPNQPFQYRFMVDGKQLPVTQNPGGPGGYAGGMEKAGANGKDKDGAKKKGSSKDARDLAYQTGKTDASGAANLEFQFPKDIQLGNALIELSTNVGRNKETVIQPIPVIPSQATIEFFPEGGDLVAGLANKVYYRVRSPLGDPIDPEGHVIILAEEEVLHDSERRQGTGSFTCTPDPKEKYLVRITGPSGVTEIKDAFAALNLKKDGFVLHVANAVDKAVAPINAVVRSTALDKRLLLTLTCRGQMIRQQFFTAQAVDNPLALNIDPNLQGVQRLTLYELTGDRPIPVAERLVYRGVSQKLDLSVRSVTGANLKPNQKCFGVSVCDESGQAKTAWMLAAVVDERFRADKQEISLPAYFHLASELGGEDLEDMPLVLGDSPEAFRGLDLFLGTSGWRRFGPARSSNPTLVARDDPKGDAKGDKEGVDDKKNEGRIGEKKDLADGQSAGDAKGKAVQGPVLFSRENQPRAELKQRFQKDTKKQENAVQLAAVQQRTQLLAERERLAEEGDTALSLLHEFDEKWAQRLRQVFWSALLALVAVGGVFLLVALIGMARRRRHGAALMGAFACLSLALVVFVSGRSTAIVEGRPQQMARIDVRPWPEIQLAANNNEDRVALTKALPVPPVGTFTAAAPEQVKKAAPALANHQVKELLDKLARADLSEGQKYLQNSQLMNQAGRATREGPDAMVLRRQSVNEEMQRIFLDAAKGQSRGGAYAYDQNLPGVTPAQPPTVPVNPVNPQKSEQPKAQPTTPDPVAKGANPQQQQGQEQFRFYAHRTPRAKVDLQDTLLWHPNLVAENGRAEVSFDLSGAQTTYRFLIYANSPDGRLGFYEGRLHATKK